MEPNQDKKKRRSKKDSEGRSFMCECGKAYLSYQALYAHKKVKHSDTISQEDFPKKKRGRPRQNNVINKEEVLSSLPSKDDPIAQIIKNWNETESKGTCDEAFAKYLMFKHSKLSEVEYQALRASVYSLRDCVNKYYERLDTENFLENESEYTITEKPAMIPNISNFYIIEFLPREKPIHDKKKEISFMLEFCRWLNEQNYTDLEIAISS
ncbi:hypothetical protein SteCoe_12503 [Stentor coeruleus]|uniref:Uncharacterized protein n=1 Tax=Stentor coeruleus TaxID=5963 RepID=A0A1R2CAN7_9CILI|nr:hypothetical protein SteCoe_12503 [Stentor coeruleus]